MLKPIEILNKSVENNLVYQKECPKTYRALLSSCSWIILITSSLLLAQLNPLNAMDRDIMPKSKSIRPQTKDYQTASYKDDAHPLTSPFWQERAPSKRLQEIQEIIKKIKNEILDNKINFIEITEKHLEEYRKIFEGLDSSVEPFEGLSFIQVKDLLNTPDVQSFTTGYSGAEVKVLPYKGTTIAIKQFKDIKVGLRELFSSLVALDINPAPQHIKMTKICDAFICTENQFHIIMEGANTHDIHHFLSTSDPESAVKACAKYLSVFHTENYKKFKQAIYNKEKLKKKFINYAGYFSNTLLHDGIEELTGQALFSLVAGKQKTDLEDVKSNNIIQLLPKDDQEKFVSLLKIIHPYFIRNSSEIYRLIDSQKPEKQNPYFLTITHGDGHGRNFFYNESNELFYMNGDKVKNDSLHRITMIDFSSIIETYGDIGDPAVDVGRFLGSLWDWAAEQKNKTYEEVLNLQNQFVQVYLQAIRESEIFNEDTQKIFEKILKENSDCYKLRYYRAIFNSEKNRKSDEVKITLLKYWIKENSHLLDAVQKNLQPSFIAEEPQLRPWPESSEKTLYHNLPDAVEGFITSRDVKEEGSYITQLWRKFHDDKTPCVALTGPGGIGKTSLSIAYAQEALSKKFYKLIYRIHSSSEFSLQMAYKDLLREIYPKDQRISIKDLDFQNVIKLVKKHLPEKTLLIFDNVPQLYGDVSAQVFLKDLFPENKNTHVLITSRCNEGWQQLLPLEEFRPQDSVKYLLQITNLDETKENTMIAEKLAKEVQHFPLALSHAAHYLRLVGGKDISALHFQEYLNGFKTLTSGYFEEKINNLTEAQSKITYENLVSRTLRMSKAYLEEKGIYKLAEELLTYCSYLDPDCIAKEIFLEHWPHQDKSKENVEKTKESIKNVFETLSSLSLIGKAQSKDSFSIHRLVQLVLPKPEETFSSGVTMFREFFAKNIKTEENVDKLNKNYSHFLNLLEYSKVPSAIDFFRSFCGDKITRSKLQRVYEEIQDLQWMSIILSNGLEPLPIISNGAEIKMLEKHLKRTINLSKKMKCPPADTPQWLLSHIDEGIPKVQFSLGLGYVSILKNPNKAFPWIIKAAQKGYALAQCVLGEAHYKGKREQYRPGSFKSAISKIFQDLGILPADLGFLNKVMIEKCEKDDKKAFEVWELPAEAQHSLGPMCYKSVFSEQCEKDNKKAFDWWEQAANQGNGEARCALGWMYYKGEHVEPNKPDIAKAFEYWKLAADQGYEDAQDRLALMYYNGEHVEPNKPNIAKAFDWWEQAANQEYAPSQAILGMLYYYGDEHTPTDKAKAFSLLMRAAEQGHVGAQYFLGYLYDKGEHVQPNKPNKPKAFEFWELAANQGHAESQYILGCMYYKGEHVQPNKAKAFECWELAANQGHPGAQSNLGAMYYNGQHVQPNRANRAKGFDLLERAANQEHVDAQYNLGVIYYDGEHVQSNKAKAFAYWERAANQGDANAQYELGCMFYKGEHVQPNKPNKEIAFKWLERAAKQGNAKAQNCLGFMYYYDEYVQPNTQNKKIAFEWWQQAAMKGNMLAQHCLKWLYYVQQINPTPIDFLKLSRKQMLTELSFHRKLPILTKEHGVITQGKNEREGNEDERLLEETFVEWKSNMKNASTKIIQQSDKKYGDEDDRLLEEAFLDLSIPEIVQQVVEENWDETERFLDATLLDFESHRKTPTPKIIQQVDEKNWDEDERLLEEAFLDLSISEVVQQSRENTPPISKTFVGKGKEEVGSTPVKKLSTNKAETLQGEPLLEPKVKVWKPSRLTCGEPQVITQQKPIQKNSENSMQNESIHVYTSQGDAYISAAIQHADERRLDLATHFAEEADKKYELAEDAKLAKKLQEEEL